MRKRKWLLVVIIILITINLVFWGMAYLFDVNSYVKNRLTNTVGKQLGATISFSALNITSKIIQISDIEIHKEDEFVFRATQLYLNYSFWQLILHNFKLERALQEVRCFSPELEYTTNFKKEQAPLTLDLEALENTLTRFNYISIINGKVDVQGEGEFVFHENLDRININLQKHVEHEWQIMLSAFQSQTSGSIEIQGLYALKSNEFTLKLKDYHVSNISSHNAFLTNALIDAEIQTNLADQVSGTAHINDIHASFHGEEFFSDGLNLAGSIDSLSIIDDWLIRWKGQSIRCSGLVRDYLSKNSTLGLSLSLDDCDLSAFDPQLAGMPDVKGKVSGSISSPVVDVTLSGNNTSYDGVSITDLYLELTFADDIVAIKKGALTAHENKLHFFGNVSIDKELPLNSELDVTLECDDFYHTYNDWVIRADATAKISESIAHIKCELSLDSLIIQNDEFRVPTLKGTVSYQGKKANVEIEDEERSIVVQGFLDHSDHHNVIEADITCNDLVYKELSKRENTFLDKIDPHINSNIQLNLNNNVVDVNGIIHFPDNRNATIRGGISIAGEVPIEPMGKEGYLDIMSDTLIVSEQVLDLSFHSLITKDNRLSAELAVNENITAHLSGILDRDDVEYSGNIFVDSLNIFQTVTMFPLFEKEMLPGGFITARFDFTGSDVIKGIGNLYITDFTFNNTIQPLNVVSEVAVDSSNISLNNFSVYNSQTLMAGDARLDLVEQNFELNAFGDDVLLEDVFSDIHVAGTTDFSIIASGKIHDPRILCDLSIEKGSLFGTSFDSFESQVFQDNDMFYLNDLDVVAPDFNLTGKGSCSYNFITEEFHDQPDNMAFHFSGDLLKSLMPYIPAMKNASGKTDIMFAIKTDDMNTLIDTACVCISDGEFTLKSQPERIKKMSCDIEVKDNILTALNGSFMMGDGHLFFRNKVHDGDSDIMIGGINIGTLLLNNDDEGITIHIPVYQPERGIVEARLEGFDSEYFSIYSDDGGWVLSGRILLSNGDAIYEKEEGSEEGEDSGLPPIYADFDLIFNKNIWYVANPFNLKIDPGDYMSFRSNRETEKLELFFDLHSRQGEMHLFGESFSAEDVIVRKARKDSKVFIDATFMKRTPDGSPIYLYVRSTEDKLNADDIGTKTYGDVEITLKSDNPDDVTMLSILSKLQYGKGINDLSDEERFDLGTEQAINLASDELSNLIFSPLISPVEGAIRQFLGLDYVRFKTGFMKNIILTSGIVESDDDIIDREYESDLELIGELSKDIILENLAIDLGKYITPVWYLNYEALIKKEMSSMNKTYIGVEHELSFTWDLPYNCRFIYRYQFYPAQGKDNQGISLETVFRF